MPSSRASSGGKRRDAGEAGVANVAVEAVMPWQHSAKQIAMNGQFLPVSELSWWQGISSAAAAAGSITMSDDIPCASATSITLTAETASGAKVRLPINRTASARTKARRSCIAA